MNSTIKKSVDDDSQKKSTSITSEQKTPSVEVKYTFMDTLNAGNELLLSDADFGRNNQVPETGDIPGQSVSQKRYRVQILASNKIETAREQKKELEKKITEPVIIGYEAPYYKLYAGSFSKRPEAQTFLVKLKKLGFTDAWVVATNIIVEK